MDSSPIGGQFHVPISPWTNQDLSSSKGAVGAQLFEQTSQFFAWYLTWDSAPADHARSFEYLSQIMQIARVSKEGGNFLSSMQEKKALDSLSSLQEDLFNGNIRHPDIQESLMHILHSLTDSNPKAKLISHTTELEYLLCIHPSGNQPSDATERYQQTLSYIISKVTPNMLDVHAHAIAQGLSKILDNPQAIPDIQQALHEAIRGWL